MRQDYHDCIDKVWKKTWNVQRKLNLLSGSWVRNVCMSYNMKQGSNI